jgi:hypothetical protein
MKIISKLFFLKRTDVNLENKWWHRLFVVLFVIFVVIFFLGSLILLNISIPENKFNVDIKYNLREFSKNSSKDIANTVPAFNLLNYEVGCLKNDNSIKHFSNFALEKSICSSDIRRNIDKISEIFLQKHPSINDSKEQAIYSLTRVLDEDTESRYCFINNDIGCSSDKIIAYQKSPVFYLEVFLISVFLTYLNILFLQLIYFKGFIYIIYGKKK